jgi:hypothetical protein
MHIFFKNRSFPIIFLVFAISLIVGCGGTSSNTNISPGPGDNGNPLDYGRIKGTVSGDSSIKLEGAVVETYQAQATTASDGTYLLGPVPAGDYRVIARATGYTPSVKENVRILPGQITENIDFTLSSQVASFSPDFAVLALVPAMGTDGDIVSVFCRGCGKIQGQVTFNGKQATVLDWNSKSDDRILVQVPSEVESGPVKVVISGESSHETQPISFTGKPVILQATPSISRGNGKVVLNGRNFNLITNFNKVKLGNDTCTVLSASSSSSLTVQLPQTAKTGIISIRIESDLYQLDGISNILVTIEPQVVYMAPKRSIPGVPITVYGYNFGTDKNSVKISFGGHLIHSNELTSVTDNKIIFNAPDNSVLAAGSSAEVKVMVNDSQSNGITYTAYNTTNVTLSDYGIYDFNAISTGGTLRLASLKETDKIAFVSVLSGDGVQDLDGNFTYIVSSYLGGNFTPIPNLPTNLKAQEINSPESSYPLNPNSYSTNKNIRAALTDPASMTMEFYVRDFNTATPWDPANDVIATATIKATGTNVLVYADVENSGLTDANFAEIAQIFDTVYSTIATACTDGITNPPEGNIDAQPRIALMVTPKINVIMDSSGEAPVAYFDNRDKDPAAQNSAGTEIIYANSEIFKTNKDDFKGGIAQILQNMIYFNQKGDEGVPYLNMGLSAFARQEIGLGFKQNDSRSVAWVANYLKFSDQVSLNHWPDAPQKAHYGMAYLFNQYLFDRCKGYNAIRVLEKKNGAIGLVDIDTNIIRGGLADPPSPSIRQFFHDFCLALYCDDLGLPTNFTGYNAVTHQFKNINIRTNTSDAKGLKGVGLNDAPAPNRHYSIKGYGCHLLEYGRGNGGDLEVTFSATPSAGDFKTWVIYYSTATP